MPFYELIYETGAHSIAFAESDAEVLVGVKAQHERALKGAVGGPSGHNAERVKRVLKYDRHPADLNPGQVIAEADLLAAVEGFVSRSAIGGEVVVGELKAVLDGLVSPVVDSEPHESNYAMAESAELTGWTS